MGATSGYAMIAAIRFKELWTRLGLALFIGTTAVLFAPSWWPVLWFVAMLAGQAVDLVLFRPMRLHPEREVSNARKAACLVSTFFNTAIYSAITLYMWLEGGEAGRLFAVIQVAGGLLHVSLHMHHSRPVLLAAVIPHSMYFLGMPLGLMIAGGEVASSVIMVIASLLYMAHLVVAVRQSSATTTALREARDEATRERERAERASAAKSDFLAVISHEIRTPMNAVISGANLLRRTRLSAEQREHVSMLLNGGDVLVGLLNDVLDFSKIEAGKMTLESAELEVRDKLESMLRLWEPRAAASGVRMKLEIDPQTPSCVRTDPLRVQQILFNLLSNAVKFTEEGVITLRAGWDADAGALEIEVEDTGCGIAEDRLDRVFASFEQAEAGTTRRFGGTGLGLAISRRLAELMGGALNVRSTAGEGSVFHLHLPVTVVAEAGPAQPVDAAHPASLAGRSILIAEDHEVNRRIISLLLEPHGCRLTLVENGADAVQTAAYTPFDAIVLDMQMPVMDGLEAARRICAEGPNADTPMIALTANALDTHRAAWRAVGVERFLTKPIDPVALAETLAEACAQPRPDRDGRTAVA